MERGNSDFWFNKDRISAIIWIDVKGWGFCPISSQEKTRMEWNHKYHVAGSKKIL